MRKRSLSANVVALIGMGVLGLGLATAGPATAEDPSIKDVMKKLNGKGASESATLKKALAASKADWTAIQASTKVYEELGASLPKNDPPKGGKDSWKKLADGFASQSKTLDDAAKKKDLAATKAAFGKISMSCMTCHQTHRGR